MIRLLLKIYRIIQYKLFGRFSSGIMTPGVLCQHEPFDEAVNHGDIVHPCVRYIEKGYLGHKWWMIYTPYYNGNENIENPILCYAVSNEADPPTDWKVFCQIQGQPEVGYNSDPTLLYADDKLYVMWRENLTKRCLQSNFVRATFGTVVTDGRISEVFGPLAGTIDQEIDNEVSPTFLKEKDGSFKCLAMHLKFHSAFVSSLPYGIKKFVNSILNIIDVLGIWSQQKCYGIAQWTSKSIDGPYNLKKTIKFTNCNKLYRPWHMDIFEYDNVLYAVVQTNQCNADICLAYSTDYENFTLFSKPLITNATIGKVGIYKPSAVVKDGIFYLFYTAQDVNDRGHNKLYVTSNKFGDLLNKLR